MGTESIPPPTPLSPEENARVHDNVGFLLQELQKSEGELGRLESRHERIWRESRNKHREEVVAVLGAVDKAKPDQVPDLPEDLWLVLQVLRERTRDQLASSLQAVWMEEVARRMY